MDSSDITKKEWNDAQDLSEEGNRAAALFRFRRIYNQGFPYASFEIGNLLESGGGNLTPDIDSAIEWYKKSYDELNDEFAIYALGRLYLTGESSGGQKIAIDNKKAFHYFDKLKNSKQIGAIYILGVMREEGLGIKKSTDDAIYWYEKAARAGHLLALARLGILHIKKFNLLFGLKCYIHARLGATKIYKENPHHWRIQVMLLTKSMQDEVFYRHSLFD